MDNAQAPLIAHSDGGGDGDGDGDGTVERPSISDDDSTNFAAIESKETGAGLFVVLLTFAAGISGLLFGYDTGVISATLVSIGTSLSDHSLTVMDKSIITSSTSLFALIISPFSSLLADLLGRKHVILYADFLFVIGAVIQAYSQTVTVMVVGRCIVGAAVGAASFVVPLYIAEIAPSSHRGRLITTNVLFITLGQMLAYVVGWVFSTYASEQIGWRWMVGLGAFPAAIQGAIVLVMPETPRWLVKVGRSEEARRVLLKAHGLGHGSTHNTDMLIKQIETEARDEQEARRLRRGQRSGLWKSLGSAQELISEGKNRRALAIACLLQGLQQLCGFNSLMYFSATIFTIVGFRSPTLTSLVVAVTNFVFTLAALGLIDKIGRRRILLYSLPVMILGLLLAAVGFWMLPLGRYSDLLAEKPSEGQEIPATIILVSIMIYVGAYAIGLGNVPWMQSELFPLAVRSIGSGIATTTNWSANFVIGLTFLPLMDALGSSLTFVLYAGICIVGYGFVWRIYPETAGLSLEEATALLEHDWGVSRRR